MAPKIKTSILVVAAILIVGSIVYLESAKPKRVQGPSSAEIKIEEGGTLIASPTGTSPTDAGKQPEAVAGDSDLDRIRVKAGKYERAKEIADSSGFINTDKITIKELVGKKVILVDFWTYSCINCQRTTPYLNAWYEKYRDQGLEIIGIHTPEFEFEKKYENVKAAVEKFSIKYPVVQDNGYATWAVYGNRYWPRKYLIDIDGFIVFDHIGEGAYEETEKKIQGLLEERMAVLGMKEAIAKDISKPFGAIPVDIFKPISPEIYFGAARGTYLGNGEAGKVGVQTLTEPTEVKTNTLYLAGVWSFTNEFAENQNSGAKIVFRYQGRNVYLVASSVSGVSARILRDGKALGAEKGADVTTSGGTSRIRVAEDRLYKVIEDPAGYGEHTLEIIIENPGLKVFTFTFG